MNPIPRYTLLSSVKRGAKILLGAWAFAVAGVIIVAVLAYVIGADAVIEYMRYASVVLFLLGIPIMLRWLK